MGNIRVVRKTQLSEAIQINTPEEEAVVREWLSAMGVVDADLKPLQEKNFWFLRDEGSEIVYVSPEEDFKQTFETVDVEEFGPGEKLAVTTVTHDPRFTFGG